MRVRMLAPGLLCIIAARLFAQDTADLLIRIKAMEARIQALESEVQNLKSEPGVAPPRTTGAGAWRMGAGGATPGSLLRFWTSDSRAWIRASMALMRINRSAVSCAKSRAAMMQRSPGASMRTRIIPLLVNHLEFVERLSGSGAVTIPGARTVK